MLQPSKKPSKKITKRLIAQIKKMKGQGMTHEEVGQALDLNAYETSKLFREVKAMGYDVPTLRKGRSLCKVKVDRKEVVKRYKKGLSSSKLAELFQCSKQHITFILKSEGVEIRGRQPELNYDRVFKLLDKGVSKKEISNRLKCNPWTVYSIIKTRKRKGRPPKVSPRGPKRVLDYDEIRNYYKEGMSGRKIAEMLGCAPSHIYRILAPVLK